MQFLYLSLIVISYMILSCSFLFTNAGRFDDLPYLLLCCTSIPFLFLCCIVFSGFHSISWCQSVRRNGRVSLQVQSQKTLWVFNVNYWPLLSTELQEIELVQIYAPSFLWDVGISHLFRTGLNWTLRDYHEVITSWSIDVLILI